MMKTRRIAGQAFMVLIAAAIIVVIGSYLHAREMALRTMSPIRDISSLHSSKILPFGLNCKNGPSWFFTFQVDGSDPGANQTHIELSLSGKVKGVYGDMADENKEGLNAGEVNHMRSEIIEYRQAESDRKRRAEQ